MSQPRIQLNLDDESKSSKVSYKAFYLQFMQQFNAVMIQT